jgi:hypothetical protein
MASGAFRESLSASRIAMSITSFASCIGSRGRFGFLAMLEV